MVNGTAPARWRTPGASTSLPFDGEGHILQFEGLWELLEPGRRQVLLGHWNHGWPAPDGMNREEQDTFFRPMAVEFFQRHLSGGETLPPDPAEDRVLYEDLDGVFHQGTAWPPPATSVGLPLSGGALLPAGTAPQAGSADFQSSVHQLNRDPGFATDCTPEQVAYVSAPLATDVRLAGNFTAELTLSSTLPDGNLAVFLYALDGDGSCPDASAREIARGLTDLRHWEYTGYGRDFPLITPTPVAVRGQPFAATVEAGQGWRWSWAVTPPS